MKKYIAIIKLTTEYAIGVNIRVITRFADSKEYLQKWMQLYPHGQKGIMQNTEVLQSLFYEFRDLTPVTEEEVIEARQAREAAKREYERMLLDDNE